MFKKNFKEFDFRGFVDFILELVDRYGLGEIRFNPEHKENFSEVQLTHIAPGRSINNPNGFVWAWKRCQHTVRRVYFDLFSKNGKRKIAMTIDLNDKFISLDREEGISSIEVEDILRNNMKIDLETKIDEGDKKKSIGILNKGRNNKFLNNKFSGLDIGIKDEGEKTLASGNIFLDRSPSIEKIEIVGRDKIEQHGDKSEVSIDNKQEKEGFVSKFFWFFIVALLVVVIGGLILYYGFGIK